MLMRQLKGEIDSWAIRFNYASYKWNGLNVYPVKSKVQNTGTDGSGSHVKATEKFDTELSDFAVTFVKDIKLDQRLVDSYNTLFHRSTHRRWLSFLQLNAYRLGF